MHQKQSNAPPAERDVVHRSSREFADSGCLVAPELSATLLTGGSDKPYVFGLATELVSKGVMLDLIGSDELDIPEFQHKPGINLINLRGDQRPDASFSTKVRRVCVYYARLLHYAAIAKPRLFHILWNNKFEFFDRTLLTLYYKSFGKRVVLTLHNVNAGKRDVNDTALNRLTLKIQYRLSDHIFVHSEKMKVELVEDFGIRESRVTVIPFGMNNAVPNTCLSPIDAKQRLGMSPSDKAILFFGNIVPYKGLEYLVSAFRQIKTQCREYRLIIAGRPNNCENYWRPIREALREDIENGRVILRTDYIPDEETELYFKAADVCVLPYRRIYQSGVLFLGYSFGLPVLAADVGSLSEDIVEGRTGFVFRHEDANDLVAAIERYFSSDLYAELTGRRHEIIEYANQRHSWDIVGRMTIAVYSHLLRLPSSELLNVRGGPAVDANVSHESAPRRVPVPLGMENVDSP